MAKIIKLKDLIKEGTWETRKFGEPLPTMADYKKAKQNKIKEEALNEIQIEAETIQDMGAAIFDVIIEFKKNFEKSDWKKNRKINSIIKQMLKLEQQLSDETQEF